MRILILQMQAVSNEQPAPRFSQWLGVLAAVLRREGHELKLAAFSRYQSGRLHEIICDFRPSAIYIEADRFAADITRHTSEFVGRNHDLPVIVGGPLATGQPDEALSISGVLAVAIGEPEVAVRDFLAAMARGDRYEQTPGMWTRESSGPVKNDLAALTQGLDLLPFADREIFGYEAYVNRTHAAEVSVCRGCPNRCTYCLNDWLAEIYLGKGPWVRRRRPGGVCDEIDALCERFEQIEKIVFTDHAFALDAAWLADFAGLYADRCGLPFTCHLRANAVDASTVRLIADAGCHHAVVEVISGSDFVRNEVFEMDTSGRQIERAFRLLDAAGIRTTAVNLIGAPYESEITLEKTVELNERLGATVVQTRLFAPLPGTRAEELCHECGWLRGLGGKAFRANEPMVAMPAMPPEALRDAFEQFNWQARHPRGGWLMRRLHQVRLGRRSLYDLFVKRPIANGRLLPSDPRAVEAAERDGVMSP